MPHKKYIRGTRYYICNLSSVSNEEVGKRLAELQLVDETATLVLTADGPKLGWELGYSDVMAVTRHKPELEGICFYRQIGENWARQWSPLGNKNAAKEPVAPRDIPTIVTARQIPVPPPKSR